MNIFYNKKYLCELRLGNYKKVLSSIKNIDLIITSPPYNIGSKSPAITGKRKYGLFDPKSYKAITDYEDNLPEKVYQHQQHDFLMWCSKHIKENGAVIYNHKPRRKNGKFIRPHKWFPRCLVEKDYFIWDRGSTHNHSKEFLYHQTECFYILAKPKAKIFFKNQDFPGGINKGVNDVWRFDRAYGNNHNAPFNQELIEHIIRCWSKEGDLICDPYSGSGTVMKAAAKLHRKFIGSELLDKYFNLAIELFEKNFI